jgi:hypothetical protein
MTQLDKVMMPGCCADDCLVASGARQMQKEAGPQRSASLGEAFASTCCRVSSSRGHLPAACHQGTRPSPLRTPRRRRALHRSVSAPGKRVYLDVIT